MKMRATILALVTTAATVVGANDPAQTWSQAAAAYDAGRYGDAEQLFESLIDDGYGNAGLFYNYGNTAFRQGDIGRAVLHYRRAWSLDPREADVRANLQLAQQRTGAFQPARSVPDLFFQEFSQREWSGVFTVTYWVTVILAAASVLSRPARRFAKPAAIVAGVIALLAATGWAYWLRWQRGGEAVVIAGKQTALYEPREESTPFFDVPEGSIVTIEAELDDWVKVRVGRDAGWVSENALTRVFPWNNG